MNFRTFEDLNNCIYKNISKLPRDIDLVVGIPRSGMLPADMIGLYLNVPIADINTYLEGKIYSTGTTRKSKNWIKNVEDAKHVLIVDDSISAGDAMREAKEKVLAKYPNSKISFMAIYALPTNIRSVDIYFEICNHPRMFEWNYMHHWGLEHACVDIDGVLCEDPTFFENDGGEKYRNFLRSATPKFIPSKDVDTLVTCRREKYRKETIQWLKSQNVRYKNLIMLGDADRVKGMTNNEYGRYKGKIYKNTDNFIFIESNYEQAIEICKVSGKQVFCVSNRKLISPKNVSRHVGIIKNDFKITAKRVVKKVIVKIKK